MRLPTYWSWRDGTLRCESHRKHSWCEQGIPAIQTNSFWNTWGNVVSSATRSSLLFPISPQASFISTSPRICFSRGPKIATFVPSPDDSSHSRTWNANRKSSNWKCGFLNACIYFSGVDHWCLKGIVNIPLTKPSATILAARLVSRVDTTPRGGKRNNKIIRFQTAPLCTGIGWMTLGETHTSISFKCKLSLKPLGWWQLDTQNT